VIPMLISWTMLVSVKKRERYTSTFMVQQLKELRRMHRGHHGYPDLIDAHLPERDLGNVWSVLEPLGNTLKGSRCLR
jgi:hypothetical protein